MKKRQPEKMHEVGIATEIYRMSRAIAEEHGGGPLEDVFVRVGELTAVEPDLLEFAWQALTMETPDARSKLHVEYCPAVQMCQSCGQTPERARGRWLPLCPNCGTLLKVEGGQELDLERVSFLEKE
ncbi:MAG: hydrogenase maturation nickel metallochaperone HypA [Thermoanaerobaculia bacterium]|nr:hydrogenase nickel incorporation protein HypA [Thermoanaerobaculia bacterium]MCK6680930.1 hydrogenase maturation nickel metallochaperone HypA [Thermoanaerobaculia bacterium]